MAPKLVNSITRAVNLCESTLAFGKAEEPAPTLSVFDLGHIVEDVLDSERLAVGDYDLVLSQNVPPPMMIRADSEQLYRVLSNLVRNARQAIVSSGKPGEITLSAYEDEARWWIEVSDNGPGLPQKTQENLFRAFQSSAHKGGSGLGLAISEELVRGHGGKLELDRTGPSGSIFSICLPKGETL